ncbi:hypothetical protein pb186bvf_006895 [Paramecium bursaria]
MSDSYKSDVERIQNLITSIRADMNKREVAKSNGKPVSMIEGEIRGGFTLLDRELDVLKTMVDKQIESKSIMANEGQTRKNKIIELINAKVEVRQKFDQAMNVPRDQAPKKNQVDVNENLRGLNKTDLTPIGIGQKARYCIGENKYNQVIRIIDQCHDRKLEQNAGLNQQRC